MDIIFEDESLIIADKPPGIESEEFVKQFKIPIDRGGLVHRLDKDTSGVLVIAKQQDALKNLQQQFREHQTKKVYTTLVYGKMEQKHGKIEEAIARDPKRKQAMKVIPFSVGRERGRRREAVTEWKLLQNLEYRIKNLGQFLIPISLLKVMLHTGRTHQIRVHMQYIGHPVLGDPMYNTKEGRKISKILGLNRQFLHATALGFRHPKTGEWVEFQSELPEELRSVLGQIR